MVRHKWMANVKTVFKLSLAQTLPLWPGCPGAGIVNSVMFFHSASCSLIHAGGVINFIVASPFLRLIDPMFDFPGIMYPLCCLGGREKNRFSRIIFTHTNVKCHRFMGSHFVLVWFRWGPRYADRKQESCLFCIGLSKTSITSLQSNCFGIVSKSRGPMCNTRTTTTTAYDIQLIHGAKIRYKNWNEFHIGIYKPIRIFKETIVSDVYEHTSNSLSAQSCAFSSTAICLNVTTKNHTQTHKYTHYTCTQTYRKMSIEWEWNRGR